MSIFKKKSQDEQSSKKKSSGQLAERPVSTLENLKQELRYRDRLVISLIFAFVILGIAYINIPSRITVYHPPQLTQGQVSKIGDIPPSTVYSFAVVFLERLMYCGNDCEKDYPQTLQQNRAFLTEKCYTNLMNHFENNRQLYRYRTRQLIPLDTSVFDYTKVKQIKKNTWIVTETFEFDEKVRGENIREVDMKYPMQIVHKNIAEHLNPYQMQLDCFAGEIERIEKN